MQKIYKGFTILEVIIVLVIAAFILLMVFLAVNQLQNLQKNTRIKNDAQRVLTEFITKTQNGPITTPTGTIFASGSCTMKTGATCAANLVWLRDSLGPMKAVNGVDYILNYYNTITTTNFASLQSSFYGVPNEMLITTQACGDIKVQTASKSNSVYSVTYYQYGLVGAGSKCIDNSSGSI